MISQTLRFDPKSGWSERFQDLDSGSTLILVFGETSLLEHPEPISELRSRFPNSHMLGCSTSGQFIEELISDRGLVATIMRFEHGSLKTKQVRLSDGLDSKQAGAELGRALAGPGLRGVFVLSDGTKTNGSLLAEGLRSTLPGDMMISGGLAGDGERFEQTWVCCDGAPERGAIAAVGLYGDTVSLWHGCQGGWEVFGPERIVTRSVANVLYELDGKPALTVYEDYLGDVAKEMPAAALRYPLALKRPDETDEVIRTVLGVSREDKTMTFAGDIPEGCSVQLMCSTSERLVHGAQCAIEMVPKKAFDEQSSVCVSISCVGRRMILRHHAEDELEIIASNLPEDVPQIGFYSYGELSPVSDLACELHNQTMTLTVFNEDKRGLDAFVDLPAAA